MDCYANTICFVFVIETKSSYGHVTSSVTQLTYFYLLLYRNAKNYVEQHSGDLNKLQHFKESRIRVRVILSLFLVLLPFHQRRFLHLGQFKHLASSSIELAKFIVGFGETK